MRKAIEETEKRFKDQINNGGKKPDASGNTEISAMALKRIAQKVGCLSTAFFMTGIMSN